MLIQAVHNNELTVTSVHFVLLKCHFPDRIQYRSCFLPLFVQSVIYNSSVSAAGSVQLVKLLNLPKALHMLFTNVYFSSYPWDLPKNKSWVLPFVKKCSVPNQSVISQKHKRSALLVKTTLFAWLCLKETKSTYQHQQHLTLTKEHVTPCLLNQCNFTFTNLFILKFKLKLCQCTF